MTGLVKKFIVFMLAAVCLGTFSCKKNEETQNDEQKQQQIPVEVVTQYIRNRGYIYQNAEDVNVPLKNLKPEVYKLMSFGDKVSVLYETTLGKDQYYRVQLPDTTEYWALKALFTEKFIVINKPHVLCYTQPDSDYVPAVKVEPGDFGYFVKELNGWVLVDFNCTYRSYKEGQPRKWVGQYWINTGYTDDLKCAKQAFYLSRANYNLLGEKTVDKESAIANLKKAFEVTNNENTEISFVLKDLLDELETPAQTSDSTND